MHVCLSRTVSDRELELSLGFRPIEVEHRGDGAQHRVSFGKVRIDRERAPGLGAHTRESLTRWHQPVNGVAVKQMAQLRMRQREKRVERNRLLETLLGHRQAVRCPPLRVKQCLQVLFVRRQARHVPTSGRELHVQRLGDRRRDLVLDGEDVRQLSIVALRPQVTSVSSGNELRRDADARACFPDASLEHGGDAQRAGDTPDVFVLAFERERRRARDHLQSGDARQRVDDLLRETVAKVFVVLVGAQVLEWQDRNRRFGLRLYSRHDLERRAHLRHRLISMRGVLLQAAAGNARQRRRGKWPRSVTQHRAQHLGARFTCERAFAREQFV